MTLDEGVRALEAEGSGLGLLRPWGCGFNPDMEPPNP